jgi:hypothetical protein
VKDCDDITVSRRFVKYHEVGEALKHGPAGLMRPGRKLFRVGGDPRYGDPRRLAKPRGHMRRVNVIPIARVGEVGPGGARKEDARRSSRLPDKLAVDALPGNGSPGVVVEGRHAAIKLALLPGSQLDLLRVEAIPQFTDEIEALLGGQARNIECGHPLSLACLGRRGEVLF